MMGMVEGENEGICKGPKALRTVFSGPYLRTRKTLLYQFLFYFSFPFPIFIMDTGLRRILENVDVPIYYR